MNETNSVEISFFIPCYNEEGNIFGTLQAVNDFMKTERCSYEVIVVDDGSTDNTTEVVKNYCRAYPKEPVIAHRNPINRGLGRNYLDWARKVRGKYYMLINGDNDVPPEDLHGIVRQRGKADIVIPYVSNQNERPLVRHLLSQLFTFLVNFLSGHRLEYYNGPVLHLRENVIRFSPQTSGFGYQAELLCQALNEGCSFIEVPFRSRKTRHSHSAAFRIANIASVLKSLGNIFLRRKKRGIPALDAQAQ